MTAVLQHCIEESEDIDQELLDILLSPLLPSAKVENPAAYNLVGSVLRRVTGGTIQGNISAFVNHVLVGTSSRANQDSELSDHIYPLIYELHKISPGLLLRVLPNVCEQLKAEEEEVRLRAVKLLGRLFASTTANYGEEFSRNFRDFVGRFIDVSAAVRLEVVDQCSGIMTRKPALRGLVEPELVKRLRDQEVDIRHSALVKLLDMALEDPLLLSVETFKEMAERVKDRKEIVHSKAMRGLAIVYGRFVSCALPGIHTLQPGEHPEACVRQDIMDRLRMVPGLLIGYWGYPDPKSRHLVLHLLQETVLPRSMPKRKENGSQSPTVPSADDKDGDIDSLRASALLVLFSLLDTDQQGNLGTVMSVKAKLRGELHAYLNARTSAMTAKNGGSASDHAAIKSSTLRVYKLLAVDKKVQPLEKIHAMKDKTIVKLLTHAVSPSDTIIDAIHAREDLKQRLDSKSALSEYTCILFDFAGSLVANEGMLARLLAYAAESSDSSVSTIAQAPPAAQLLTVLAKHASWIFSDAAQAVDSWLSSLVESAGPKALGSHGAHGGAQSQSTAVHTLQQCLRVIELSSAGLAEDEGSGELCSKLLTLAQSQGDIVLCETCARVGNLLAHHTAAVALQGSSKGRPSVAHQQADASTVQAVAALCSPKRLVMTNKRLHVDLSVLTALLEIPRRVNTADAKRAFSPVAQATRKARSHILRLIREDVLCEQVLSEKRDKTDKGKKEEEIERVQLCVAALRCWAALLGSEEELAALRPHEKAPTAESSSTVARNNEAIQGISEEMNELIDVLFECIEKNGTVLAGCNVASSNAVSRLYITAATAAMNFIAIRPIGEGLQVAKWKRLAWTLVEGDAAVRAQLAENLFDILHTSPVHARFLAYPCLLAAEGDALGSQAQRVLFFAISRLRRTQEVLSQYALDSEDDAALRRARDNMPETALPFLLYLLSYHPEFPQSQDVRDAADQKRLRSMVSVLRLALRALTETLGGEENNLSFLLKQVNLVSFYDDVFDRDNIGLDFVTLLAGKILNEMVKSDEHVAEYHGDISLPMELFVHKPDARGRQRGSASDNILPEGTAAMDRVLLAGKHGKKAHVGPTKGQGGQAVPQRKRAVSDAEDENDENGKGKRKQAAAPKRHKVASHAEPEPETAYASSRPKRSAAGAVSYREADENDGETAQWDNAAGLKIGPGAQQSGRDVDIPSSPEEERRSSITKKVRPAI